MLILASRAVRAELSVRSAVRHRALERKARGGLRGLAGRLLRDPFHQNMECFCLACAAKNLALLFGEVVIVEPRLRETSDRSRRIACRRDKLKNRLAIAPKQSRELACRRLGKRDAAFEAKEQRLALVLHVSARKQHSVVGVHVEGDDGRVAPRRFALRRCRAFWLFGLFVVVARPCTYEFAFFVFKVSAGIKKGVRSAGNGHNGVKRVEAEHRP